jgi:hypothetical protein
MSTNNKLRKTFTVSILKLIEQALVMHTNLEEQLPLFNARFAFINSAFAAQFKNAIDIADNMPSDESVLDLQQITTAQLYSQMQLARNAYNSLLTYVKLAFPKRADVKELFGNKKYTAARFNLLKMKELLELAHAMAQKPEYKTPLINKGYTQADIDELAAIIQNLKAANLNQETAKAQRYTTTFNRIQACNSVYDYMQQINKASKVVFMNNYAMLQHFKLHKNTTAKTKKNSNKNSNNKQAEG